MQKQNNISTDKIKSGILEHDFYDYRDLIIFYRQEPRVSSWVLKNGFNLEHRSLTKLIKKYKSEFEEFGLIAPSMQKVEGKIGRPISAYLLNEDQTYFLGTLLPNTDIVRQFKRVLVRNFSTARTIISQKLFQQTDPILIAQRQAGKITRRIETDIIKEFVEYAFAQGSTNAKMYYKIISCMENDKLFLLEQNFKNLRDILNLNQLATIDSADAIVSKALTDGMQSNLYYKDIYKLAKSRVETFAELRGKTFIPSKQEIEYIAMA